MRRGELDSRQLVEPHTSRLDPSREDCETILGLHATAMESGTDGYVDPSSGLFVFTAAWLADQGSCCESTCRHCPYIS